jgi:large subunit ribosomal protein L32
MALTLHRTASSSAMAWIYRTVNVDLVQRHALRAAAIGSLAAAKDGLAWIPSLISDIWGAILLAAPKRRATHQTKRTRQNAPENKLQNKQNITVCPFCGEPKLLHHLCHKCFTKVNAKYSLPDVREIVGGKEAGR